MGCKIFLGVYKITFAQVLKCCSWNSSVWKNYLQCKPLTSAVTMSVLVSCQGRHLWVMTKCLLNFLSSYFQQHFTFNSKLSFKRRESWFPMSASAFSHCSWHWLNLALLSALLHQSHLIVFFSRLQESMTGRELTWSCSVHDIILW